MQLYEILLILFLAVVVLGIFKGCGDNRSIVVFRDYDDLGLTFLIPVSFFLVVYVLSALKVDQVVSFFSGAAISIIIFIKLARDTYIDNGNNVSKTALSLITKIPLSVIWIFNLIQVLNPSGKGAQRSKNRGEALVVLTLLTPIIGMLVVEKNGSYFNPKSWIAGRRVGRSVRDNL